MIRTWQWFPPGKLRSKIAQALCALTIGHQDSGDKGYNGGEFEDRWCRWCNRMYQIPKGQFARFAEWRFGKIGIEIKESK